MNRMNKIIIRSNLLFMFRFNKNNKILGWNESKGPSLKLDNNYLPLKQQQQQEDCC